MLLVWVISISLGQLSVCYALCAIGPGSVTASDYQIFYCPTRSGPYSIGKEAYVLSV